MFQSYNPSDLSTKELHGFLLSAVAPRPIAFVSTIDANGNINLSPFSFFNVFSANPPVLIFSPARRVRDNTTKHTLENVLATKECVVNIVSHEIVQQMSLSSTEYDQGINEFVKSGLTQVDSEYVKSPRVGESKVAFECKVNDVIQLGENGGAGNLVICEVIKVHIQQSVLTDKGTIDTKKLNLVGRMGESWYVHANHDALFTIPKPLRSKGIGFDSLPENILNSTVLTGNDLAMLANVETLPTGNFSIKQENHLNAKQLLLQKKVADAWNALIE